MKLTDNDKAYLRSIGVDERDFLQIGDAADHTKYELCDEDGKESVGSTTKSEAINRLGREGWLNGLARSAFHVTAMRQTADGKNYILFDSGEMFE